MLKLTAGQSLIIIQSIDFFFLKNNGNPKNNKVHLRWVMKRDMNQIELAHLLGLLLILEFNF